MDFTRPLAPAALALAAAVTLVGCGSQTPADTSSPSAAASASADAPASVTVEDNRGEQTVTTPPTSVAAFDNRTFETLNDWGVKLSVAAVGLMPATNPYKEDASIADVGTHNEPNLELIVPADEVADDTTDEAATEAAEAPVDDEAPEAQPAPSVDPLADFKAGL